MIGQRTTEPSPDDAFPLGSLSVESVARLDGNPRHRRNLTKR